MHGNLICTYSYIKRLIVWLSLSQFAMPITIMNIMAIMGTMDMTDTMDTVRIILE